MWAQMKQFNLRITYIKRIQGKLEWNLLSRWDLIWYCIDNLITVREHSLYERLSSTLLIA